MTQPFRQPVGLIDEMRKEIKLMLDADPYLMHFLKYKRHTEGSSKKQKETYLNEHFNLIVPKMEEQLDIIKNTHNLGHFKSET
ncbi:hypothetical protein BpHYR1_021998, partial [Brachionus plicatilis]